MKKGLEDGGIKVEGGRYETINSIQRNVVQVFQTQMHLLSIHWGVIFRTGQGLEEGPW